MNCRDASDTIWAYLDRELESSLHRRVTRHLDRCDGCLHRFRGEEALELTFDRALLQGVPTPRMWDRIDKALDLADTMTAVTARRSWPAIRIALVAAALLLAALIAFPSQRPSLRPEIPALHRDLARVGDRPLGVDRAVENWHGVVAFAEEERDRLGFAVRLDRRPVRGVEPTGVSGTTVGGAPALIISARETGLDRPFRLVVLDLSEARRRFGESVATGLESGATGIRVESTSIAIRFWAEADQLVAAVGLLPPERLAEIVDDLCDLTEGQVPSARDR